MKKKGKGKHKKKKFDEFHLEDYKKKEPNININNNNQIDEKSELEEKVDEKKENIDTEKPKNNTPIEDDFFKEMNKNSNKKEQIKNKFSNYNPGPKIDSFLELKILVEKNIEELISYFNQINLNDYNRLVKNMSDEEIFDLIKILRKIIENDSKEALNIIYNFIENTSLFKIYINQFIQDSNNCSIQCLYFMSDYLIFYKNIMNYFYKEEKYKKISLFKESFIEVITDSSNYDYNLEPKKEELCLNIYEMFNLIKEKEKAYLEEKFFGLKYNNEKKENEEIKKLYENIPIDYKEQSILIEKKDFFKDEEKEIVKHKSYGPYISYLRYLNTLFYLEYEDCYRYLRRAINDYSYSKKIEEIKKNKDIFYYDNVSIVGVETKENGIILTIDFKVNYKIRFTKRMLYGSLLILTNKNLDDFLFTTVDLNPYIEEDKNLENKIKIPKFPHYSILVKIVNPSIDSFQFLNNHKYEELQIFESKAYFESYVHFLKRLKNINPNELPFKSEIIDLKFKNMRPEYLSLRFIKKMSKDIKNGSLDSSQQKAINFTLNNRITLIQGPPGTGKTYVGGNITNILLKKVKSPILVVCYTNHALDQFIEHIMEYNKNIVRIGGRCKNEKIKQFMIKNLRQHYHKPNHEKIISILKNYTNLFDYREYIKINKCKIHNSKIIKQIINNFYSLIEYEKKNGKEEFQKIINDEQINNLLFYIWCGKIKINKIYQIIDIDKIKRKYLDELFDTKMSELNNQIYNEVKYEEKYEDEDDDDDDE